MATLKDIAIKLTLDTTGVTEGLKNVGNQFRASAKEVEKYEAEVATARAQAAKEGEKLLQEQIKTKREASKLDADMAKAAEAQIRQQTAAAKAAESEKLAAKKAAVDTESQLIVRRAKEIGDAARVEMAVIEKAAKQELALAQDNEAKKDAIRKKAFADLNFSIGESLKRLDALGEGGAIAFNRLNAALANTTKGIETGRTAFGQLIHNTEQIAKAGPTGFAALGAKVEQLNKGLGPVGDKMRGLGPQMGAITSQMLAGGDSIQTVSGALGGIVGMFGPFGAAASVAIGILGSLIGKMETATQEADRLNAVFVASTEVSNNLAAQFNTFNLALANPSSNMTEVADGLKGSLDDVAKVSVSAAQELELLLNTPGGATAEELERINTLMGEVAAKAEAQAARDAQIAFNAELQATTERLGEVSESEGIWDKITSFAQDASTLWGLTGDSLEKQISEGQKYTNILAQMQELEAQGLTNGEEYNNLLADRNAIETNFSNLAALAAADAQARIATGEEGLTLAQAQEQAVARIVEGMGGMAVVSAETVALAKEQVEAEFAIAEAKAEQEERAAEVAALDAQVAEFQQAQAEAAIAQLATQEEIAFVNGETTAEKMAQLEAAKAQIIADKESALALLTKLQASAEGTELLNDLTAEAVKLSGQYAKNMGADSVEIAQRSTQDVIAGLRASISQMDMGIAKIDAQIEKVKPAKAGSAEKKADKDAADAKKAETEAIKKATKEREEAEKAQAKAIDDARKKQEKNDARNVKAQEERAKKEEEFQARRQAELEKQWEQQKQFNQEMLAAADSYRKSIEEIGKGFAGETASRFQARFGQSNEASLEAQTQAAMTTPTLSVRTAEAIKEEYDKAGTSIANLIVQLNQIGITSIDFNTSLADLGRTATRVGTNASQLITKIADLHEVRASLVNEMAVVNTTLNDQEKQSALLEASINTVTRAADTALGTIEKIADLQSKLATEADPEKFAATAAEIQRLTQALVGPSTTLLGIMDDLIAKAEKAGTESVTMLKVFRQQLATGGTTVRDAMVTIQEGPIAKPEETKKQEEQTNKFSEAIGRLAETLKTSDLGSAGAAIGKATAEMATALKAGEKDISKQAAAMAGAALGALSNVDGIVKGFRDTFAEKGAGGVVSNVGDITMQVGQALLSAPPPINAVGAAILAVGFIGSIIGKLVTAFEGRAMTQVESAEDVAAAEAKVRGIYESQIEAVKTLQGLDDSRVDTARERLDLLEQEHDLLVENSGFARRAAEMSDRELANSIAQMDVNKQKQDDLMRTGERSLELGRDERKAWLESQGIQVEWWMNTSFMVEEQLKNLEAQGIISDEMAAALKSELDYRKAIGAELDTQLSELRSTRDLLIDIALRSNNYARALFRSNQNLAQGVIDVNRALGTTFADADEAMRFLNSQGVDYFQNLSEEQRQYVRALMTEYEAVGDAVFSDQENLINLRKEAGKFSDDQAENDRIAQDQLLDLYQDELARLESINATEEEKLALEIKIRDILNQQNGELATSDKLLTKLVRDRQLMRQAGASPAAIAAQTQAIENRLREKGMSEDEIAQFLATLPKYALGGPINRDGAIYAHEGEFMLPKDLVDQIGLDALKASVRANNPVGILNSPAARVFAQGQMTQQAAQLMASFNTNVNNNVIMNGVTSAEMLRQVADLMERQTPAIMQKAITSGMVNVNR